MFDLQFLSGPEQDPDEPDAVFLRGRIVLGGFTEEFRAPVLAWQAADYQRQWLEAARRLLGGAGCVGFVTHYAHRDAGHHLWWPAWREGDTVHVQSGLLLADELEEPFDPEEPDRHVSPRRTDPGDGEPISEWTVPLADIADFVRRRGTTPIVAA